MAGCICAGKCTKKTAFFQTAELGRPVWQDAYVGPSEWCGGILKILTGKYRSSSDEASTYKHI